MPEAPTRGLLWAGAVLGFALGGFFDGILLHQVLQWHHFLSLLPGETWQDLRNQVLADGWFHVGVYAIAALGLWMLWRARAGVSATAADRRLVGAALLGFAAWQIVDVAGIHWIVGIHRVRVDVPNPLLWDIGWLVATGVPPLLLGLWLLRGRTPLAPGRGGAVAALLALAVAGAAPLAALPSGQGNSTLVVFRSGMEPLGVLEAVAASGGRLVSASPDWTMAEVALDPGANPWALYRHGALLVGRASPAGGCLGWSVTRRA
jgi:uncharacterized membrane protein